MKELGVERSIEQVGRGENGRNEEVENEWEGAAE